MSDQTARSRRRWPALVAAFALIIGLAPLAASQTAAAGPGASDASAVGDPQSSDAKAITIQSPADGILVPSTMLAVRVTTASGATNFRARLDEGDVTARFRRVGRQWVGLIPKVAAGGNTVVVSADVRGKTESAHVFVTVKGKQANLIENRTPGAALLQGAQGAGVKPVALWIEPKAGAEAWLNGRRVTLPGPGVGAVRSIVLSGSDGVRAGANQLVVQAYRSDGSWETLTLPFTVAAGAPLVEAGAPRRVRIGGKVVLDGTGSRPGSTRSRLTYRWRLLDGPTGLTAPQLTVGPKAVFTPTKAGRYRFAVTVTERAGARLLTGTDSVSIDSLADSPPLGTRLAVAPPADGTDNPGITLGSQLDSWKTLFGDAKLGVYGVDPITLGYPQNDGQDVLPKGLSSPNPDGDLKAYLNSVPQQTIVVITGADGCCTASSWLPHSGPFAHVFAYAGKDQGNIGSGTWNRGLQFSNTGGGFTGLGGLDGFLRYQTGQTKPGVGNGSTVGSYRYVADGDARYSTSAPSVATGGISDGATYRLSVPDGSRTIGITDGNQGPVRMQARAADPSQQWQLRRVYGDFVEIVNRRSGMCLNLSGTDGKTILQWPCTGRHDSNELWLPRWTTATKDWRLVSADSTDPSSMNTVTRSGDDVVISTTVDPANQGWKLDIPPGVYTITSPQGKALAGPDYQRGGGAQLVTATVTNELRQQWRLLDRDGGAFALQDLASGLCVSASGLAAGAQVQRQACDVDAAAQRWEPAGNDDGLHLRPAGSGLYLTDSGGNLTLQSYNNMSSAKPVWLLNRQPDPLVGGYYSLSSVGTLQSLQSPSAGKAVAADGAAPTAAQDWQLREGRRDEPGSGLVQLVNPRTGQCLNKGDDPFANPIGVRTGKCADWADNPESTWRLSPAADGSFALTTIDTDQAPLRLLTVAADGTLSGQEDSGSADQHWLFTGRPVTFQIGTTRYPVSLPAGGSGFAVMATDQAQRPLAGYPKTYLTYGVSGTGADQVALANDLEALGNANGATVLVQSAGRPKVNTGNFNGIGDAMSLIGGDKLALMLMNGGDIAVAGCSRCNNSPVYTEAVRRGVDPNAVGARLEGSLDRDANGTLVPGAATAARVDQTFFDLAARTPSKWPYSTPNSNERKIVDTIADMLQLPNDTCHAGDLDRVRSAYCLWDVDEAAPWDTYRLDLNNYTATQIRQAAQSSPLSDDSILAVRNQIVAELGQLTKLHTLMKGQRDLYADAVYNNQDSAESVANTITGQLGQQGPTKNVLGGVMKVLNTGWTLTKPILPIVVGADEPGSPDPEPDNPAPDAIDSGLGMITAIVDLASANSDASTQVSQQISTDAHNYANALDAQYGRVIANISTVENVIASDPLKLTVVAENSTLGWNLDTGATTRQAALMKAGALSDMWLTLMPLAYEMWQWPSIPNGLTPTDIACENTTWVVPSDKYHYIYPGQDNRGMFTPPSSLDANGNGQNKRTLLLTRGVDTYVGDNSDRVLKADLAGHFFDATGLAAVELVRDPHFTLRNYASGMGVSPGYCVLWPNKKKVFQFGPAYY